MSDIHYIERFECSGGIYDVHVCDQVAIAVERDDNPGRPVYLVSALLASRIALMQSIPPERLIYLEYFEVPLKRHDPENGRFTQVRFHCKRLTAQFFLYEPESSILTPQPDDVSAAISMATAGQGITPGLLSEEVPF